MRGVKKQSISKKGDRILGALLDAAKHWGWAEKEAGPKKAKEAFHDFKEAETAAEGYMTYLEKKVGDYKGQADYWRRQVILLTKENETGAGNE